jgi:hypothetical protein
MQITTKYKNELNTMRISDPIRIWKVGRQHLCYQNQHTEGQGQKEKEQKANNCPLSKTNV